MGNSAETLLNSLINSIHLTRLIHQGSHLLAEGYQLPEA